MSAEGTARLTDARRSGRRASQPELPPASAGLAVVDRRLLMTPIQAEEAGPGVVRQQGRSQRVPGWVWASILILAVVAPLAVPAVVPLRWMMGGERWDVRWQAARTVRDARPGLRHRRYSRGELWAVDFAGRVFLVARAGR
jgi:hypothetical protein